MALQTGDGFHFVVLFPGPVEIQFDEFWTLFELSLKLLMLIVDFWTCFPDSFQKLKKKNYPKKNSCDYDKKLFLNTYQSHMDGMWYNEIPKNPWHFNGRCVLVQVNDWTGGPGGKTGGVGKMLGLDGGEVAPGVAAGNLLVGFFPRMAWWSMGAHLFGESKFVYEWKCILRCFPWIVHCLGWLI